MNLLTKLVLGAIGGFSATAPMTASMLAMHRRLPVTERYPLPPREIAAKAVDFGDRNADTLFTMGSHFAYGSAMGAAYAAIVSNASRNWAVKGAAAGVGVWIFSYLFLLPLLRILRPAHRQTGERNLLMIVAHLIWGIVLGGFYASSARDETSRGIFAGSPRAHRDRL